AQTRYADYGTGPLCRLKFLSLPQHASDFSGPLAVLRADGLFPGLGGGIMEAVAVWPVRGFRRANEPEARFHPARHADRRLPRSQRTTLRWATPLRVPLMPPTSRSRQ